MKPLLAATPDSLTQVKFPKLGSLKLDGIRAIIMDNVVYSRKLKPIPNIHVQRKFSHLNGHDGELIWGHPTSPSCFRDTSSACMSQSNESGAQVDFYAFDYVLTPELPYTEREREIDPRYKHAQTLLNSLDDLLEYEDQAVLMGYEGVILRDPWSRYKYGRSTMREQILIKIKRFVDSEFEVIGFEEKMHNANPAQRNEIGQLKRSSHKANQVPMDTLGSLVIQDPITGLVSSVGSGFTDAERNHIWRNKELYLGRLAKVKFLSVGMKELPRHPTFLGWRDD